MYEMIQESKRYLQSIIQETPTIGIVLGSGLTAIVDELTEKIEVNYLDIPNFKTSSVKGHSSKLVFGRMGDKYVALMTGRFHFYEGHSMREVTFPLYVLKALGVETAILTNSCGGINTELLMPGSIMTVNDFINLMPSNPLIGLNDDRIGTRFPDMTEPYDLELRALVKKYAPQFDIPFVEGVYAGFMGPYYESKAEIQMIKGFGADAVGMSTVPETIALNHMGVKVLAFATITNMATGIQKMKHSHDNVVKVAKEASKKLGLLIKEVVKNI